MMERSAFVIALVLVASACGAKGKAADGDAALGASADSSPAVSPPPESASMAMPVSRDSTKAGAGSTAAQKAAAKAPDVIGHDSAFGPKYMVDSTGKLVPIPTKRP
jgi:hypothetical protein